jgi:chemotaxis protein methyltransferase CheR
VAAFALNSKALPNVGRNPMTPLTSEQFDRTRRLALRLAGIELFERHREILGRRCRRLGIDDPAAFDALLDAADGGEKAASRQLIGLLTTNYTGFFRHPRHFEVATEHALWAVHRRGEARLWSTAAATGEEPYSLAIASIDVFRRDDPAVTIVATDIDEETLAVARQAEYGQQALGALEQRYRERFFSEAEPASPATLRRWRVAQAARDLVTFRAVNLARVEWPLEGPFDVIFCRNVLMYLDPSYRYSVLERLASMLAPDGMLILDPAEHLGRAGHLFVHGTDGVYSRLPRSRARSFRLQPRPRDEVQ